MLLIRMLNKLSFQKECIDYFKTVLVCRVTIWERIEMHVFLLFKP